MFLSWSKYSVKINNTNIIIFIDVRWSKTNIKLNFVSLISIELYIIKIGVCMELKDMMWTSNIEWWFCGLLIGFDERLIVHICKIPTEYTISNGLPTNDNGWFLQQCSKLWSHYQTLKCGYIYCVKKIYIFSMVTHLRWWHLVTQFVTTDDHNWC
jgi:hypothetical protein